MIGGRLTVFVFSALGVALAGFVRGEGAGTSPDKAAAQASERLEIEGNSSFANDILDDRLHDSFTDFPVFTFDGRETAHARAGTDNNARRGPDIPEPMVFDLVRQLGARKGELEFNVLNLVPFRKGEPTYEWAPEVEYALFDGFAIEFEIPIFDMEIAAHKFAAQYTFGTAFNDAFIHGAQAIALYNIEEKEFVPTFLYVAGIRFDERWSALGMFGGSYGTQVFPFSDEPNQNGVDVITNLSIFADINDRITLGVETNYSRQVRGIGEFLVMPQIHIDTHRHVKLQFGYGLRDDETKSHGELGFRIIAER